MRTYTFFCRSFWLSCLALLLFLPFSGIGQTLLYAEDFNACDLPGDWGIDLVGFADADYYVGTPQNANSDGSTIDGTCMLIMDDDATGDQTPPWNLKLSTPSFDGTGFSTVELSVDVHFRNYIDSAYLKIHVWDGTEYQELATWKGPGSSTGVQFSEYVTFTSDLSFYANPAMHVMFEYDDGGAFAWWAGIDNVAITGMGDATNVLLQNFNDCSMPPGWTVAPLYGNHDWQFGLVDNSNAWASNSMNGTCFAYFDDDGIGEDAPLSAALLASPVFDGTLFANFILDFDVILRRALDQEGLQIFVYDGVEFNPVATYLTDLGGPQFNEYIHETVDLTPFRAAQMQLVFMYVDGGGWGWWAGLDNIKVSGFGEINDLCAHAVDIFLDEPCQAGDNTMALFDGPDPSCAGRHDGSMWYLYSALESGIVEIKTGADFNDLITVFTGTCDAPEELTCYDRDAHGFEGEDFYFNVESGTDYFIRLSGKEGGFGLGKGSFCIELLGADAYPEIPINDLCADAIALTLDADCPEGNNYWADYDGPEFSSNILARANVWYSFEAPTTDSYLIKNIGDFADGIMLYTGDCSNPQEIANSYLGHSLETPVLNSGQLYYVSVSGSFATIEGNLCVRLELNNQAVPINDDCVDAMEIVVGADCVFAENLGATMDGPVPSCQPFPSATIWFGFEAPVSGAVQLNTGADFVHSVSVYQGTCDNLEEIYCGYNPLYCAGYFTVGSLVPGEFYFVQIASADQFYGIDNEGSVCISLIDGNEPTPFEPFDILPNIECLDESLAIFDYEISGGTPPFSLIGDEAGVFLNQGDPYLVIVEDSKGCQISISGVISCGGGSACDYDVLSTATDVSCFGGSDGMASIEVLGDTDPYLFSWPGGLEGPIQNDLSAGTYLITITDVDGCIQSAAVFIEQPDPIQLEVDTVIASLPGVPSGSIEISVSGGSGTYSFAWYLDGELISNEEDPTNLAAGIYTLELVDGTGCVSAAEVLVELNTSIDNPLAGLDLEIYPNPNNGLFMLNFIGDWPGEVQLQLYDVTGRLLLIKETQAGHSDGLELQLPESAASGVYELRIIGADFQMVRSISVIR